MIAANDAHKAAEAFCESYVAAFDAFDAAAISAHWQFPALILSHGRQIVFSDADRFLKNTDGLIAFYKREGVHKVVRNVEQVMAVGNGTFAMRVHDRMYNSSGQKLVEWSAGYLLSETETGLKAVVADASGELQAWENRGTPLGS